MSKEKDQKFIDDYLNYSVILDDRERALVSAAIRYTLHCGVEKALPSDERPAQKWFPIEFCGFWHIHSEPYYEADDVLDADRVGEEAAKANAELAARAPELLQQNRELSEQVNKLSAIVTECVSKADKTREDIRELIETLRACFKILEQTKIHRKAFNLTGGNIFLDSTIDKVEELLKKYEKKT